MNMNAVTTITAQGGSIPGPAREAVKFTMRGTQLLSSGMTTIPLTATDNLWIASKVYSSGGENALHAHNAEDHMFFVLQGKAEFHFGDGSTTVADTFEGVSLPKQTMYRFHSIGEGNLVMLRVGGGQRKDLSAPFTKGSPADIRVGTTTDGAGNPILNTKSIQKGKTPAEPVIPLEGQVFPRT
jgi:mannose-6-phosphate isomerase-like protein (cupin superfamily)